MELTIKGTPDEIKNVLQNINESLEHKSLQGQIITLSETVTKIKNEMETKASNAMLSQLAFSQSQLKTTKSEDIVAGDLKTN